MSIKSGFFNAIKDAEGNYDRTYTSEDMNTFFKGIINQNGVFNQYGERCMVDYPLDVTPTSPISDIRVTALEAVDGVQENQIMLRVKSGKALVNSHWVTIDADEYIYLDRASQGTVGRYDMVTLRWNEVDRDIKVVVTRGDDGDIMLPQPIGYDSVNNVFYEDDGVCEIVLAYVYVPGTLMLNTVGDIQIKRTIGERVCPWISHLVIGPEDIDLDIWLANYKKNFVDWFTRVKEELDLDQHIDHIAKTLVSYDGNMSRDIYLDQWADYLFETDDIVHVFYNGLKLVEGDEYEIILDEETNRYFLRMLKLNSREGVPAGNTVELDIFKKNTIAIPNGDEEKY